jgi:spoIIIJ-associated protein
MEKLEREAVLGETETFVRRVIEACGLDLEVTGKINGQRVEIELDGEDIELVLADNARLLYAVNHLVNQIFYRRAKKETEFLIDCCHYRSERSIELELMAVKAAEKVRLSGRSIALQPMPASERRIIHLALQDLKDVRTESEGTGRYRHVLIVPA